ncbi:hypothetical protein JL720_11552 [Aureococcus anophagefferens]|nr:hypothetical protein JL720_11552 [Aureococcus anophagefferens]
MQGLRGPDDSGDVDAFLLLLMRHWAAAVLDREDKARTAAGSDAVVGGAGGALQSSRAFDRAKTSLKIADLAPPVAPSSAQDIVGAMNFRRDALRHVKRDLGAALIMMKRAADKFKSEAEKPSTATNVLKFHLFNDRWGQLRSLLDTIHKLRGIHVAYTTKQIDDGHVSRDDAEKDSPTSPAGAAPTSSSATPGRAAPRAASSQPRKIKGEHKITQRGAK